MRISDWSSDVCSSDLTDGVYIGRRHFPLNSPFQNGPIHGREVFIPLSQLLGGEDYAGKGWQMLNEQLSIGRSITLPSTASGGAKMGARSEEHTSELQSLMRISYAVFCLKKKKKDDKKEKTN